MIKQDTVNEWHPSLLGSEGYPYVKQQKQVEKSVEVELFEITDLDEPTMSKAYCIVSSEAFTLEIATPIYITITRRGINLPPIHNKI